MAKFKDSQGNDLIENKVVISELRKILSSVADLQEDEIIDDNEVAMEQLKAKGYEYSISFPLTFSNFDYQKMQEYGFTDEKLHKELSENVAKNIYDGAMAIILNGETDATNDLVDNGYAVNYSINKNSDSGSSDDKMTNINVPSEETESAIRDIIKYHTDTFATLYGKAPKNIMILGTQENTLRIFNINKDTDKDSDLYREIDGTTYATRLYEVHRNDNGLLYFVTDDGELPFICRIVTQDDSDEFRIAVYKRETAHVLYCKLFE